MANLGYIQLVRICNQRCRFCSNPETDYRLTLEEARTRVDDFVARGYDGVILTGGEPTLYGELEAVIRYATDRDIGVRLITNGQKTADREFTEALFQAGLRHVHISVHSSDAKLQAQLTENPDSLPNISRSMDHFGDLGINVDANITIQAYNCDHLDRIVTWLAGRWPFVRHYVFNNLDPSGDRVAEYPDTVPRLVDIELSLLSALRFLEKSGRTCRVERLPLCYMVEFAYTSTETRKIVKAEERIVHFLDGRGMVRQTTWEHGKTETCRQCFLDSICAGLFEMGTHYDPAELYAVFVNKESTIRRIQAEQG